MLEFEKPIKNLEDKIEELRNIGSDGQVNIIEEINVLQKKCNILIKDIYSNLTPWQITQIARHPDRPYTLDYINLIFKNFHELHGDRAYADDNAIVAGIAQYQETSVAVITLKDYSVEKFVSYCEESEHLENWVSTFWGKDYNFCNPFKFHFNFY